MYHLSQQPDILKMLKNLTFKLSTLILHQKQISFLTTLQHFFHLQLTEAKHTFPKVILFKFHQCTVG